MQKGLAEFQLTYMTLVWVQKTEPTDFPFKEYGERQVVVSPSISFSTRTTSNIETLVKPCFPGTDFFSDTVEHR